MMKLSYKQQRPAIVPWQTLAGFFCCCYIVHLQISLLQCLFEHDVFNKCECQIYTTCGFFQYVNHTNLLHSVLVEDLANESGTHVKVRQN